MDLGQLFMDDNYSLESLLSKTQENQISLTQLRKLLLQHQQDLNQTSLELFNNNYDRFYELSYIISCLAEPIQHLTNPLQTFRDQLNNLCFSHDAYIDEINKKLSSLEDTCKNKELLILLVALIKRRDRLEERIKKTDWSIVPSTEEDKQEVKNIDYKIKCDQQERVKIELYHLINEVRAIQPTRVELIQIKILLETSINVRQRQLEKWFKAI